MTTPQPRTRYEVMIKRPDERRKQKVVTAQPDQAAAIEKVKRAYPGATILSAIKVKAVAPPSGNAGNQPTTEAKAASMAAAKARRQKNMRALLDAIPPEGSTNKDLAAKVGIAIGTARNWTAQMEVEGLLARERDRKQNWIIKRVEVTA